MRVFRQEGLEDTAIVGWGVRALLLSDEAESGLGTTARKLAGLGGLVEIESDAFAALETLIDDSTGYGLFVVECDSIGGLEAGRRLIAMLRKGGVGVPVVLLSAECAEQEFPTAQGLPVILRAPVSAISLRVGFEHAMRDRLIFCAAGTQKGAPMQHAPLAL